MKRTILKTCLILAAAPLTALAGPVSGVGIWHAPSDSEAVSPPPYADPAAPQGGTLLLSAIGTFDSFNPYALRGAAAGYLRRTYESLGEPISGDSLKMRGLIAQSFEIAPDASFMDVTLRSEAKFSDGAPVTANDVVYSFNALLKESLPTHRLYYAQVKSAEKLSSRKVRFRFEGGPNRELPLIVAQLPVLPSHWFKGKNLGEPLSRPFPGSGPYQVESFKMGSALTLKKNPAYWGKDLPFNAGRHNFERIKIDYFRDRTVAREAFFAGETDYYPENSIKDWELAYNVPAVQKGDIRKVEAASHDIFGMSGIFINTRKKPLSDIRVREALSRLFDFERINRSLFYGAYTRCESFFSGSEALSAKGAPSEKERELLALLPGSPSGVLPALPVNDGSGNIRTRLAESLKLFKEAGFTLKDGKMLSPEGEPLVFSMPVVSRTQMRTLEPWVRNLARAGVRLKLELIDQTQYVSRVRLYDYDFLSAVIRESANPGNEQRYFWGSEAGKRPGSRNYAGIADPAVDAAIEAVVSAGSEDAHRTAVLVLDRLLRAGHYVVPGWYSTKARFSYWRTRISVPPSWEREGSGIDMSVWHKAP